MTEQEYEKLVEEAADCDSQAFFSSPGTFLAGIKWARENPGPEVQALVDVTRQLAECRPDKQQCEMFTLRTAARGAIARFKERAAGKGEG